MGIDVEKTIMLTFFIGGALAGAAGLIQGMYYNIGMWWMGYQAGLRAFTAAVLGGHRQHAGRRPRRPRDRLPLRVERPVHLGALDERHRLLDPDPGPRVPAPGTPRRAASGQGVSRPPLRPRSATPARRPARHRARRYPFLDRWLHAQTVHAVTDAMIYVLLALGLNIVVGYAGLLDLGYAAFFAIGAYTMGLLNSPGARLAALRARVELLGDHLDRRARVGGVRRRDRRADASGARRLPGHHHARLRRDHPRRHPQPGRHHHRHRRLAPGGAAEPDRRRERGEPGRPPVPARRQLRHRLHPLVLPHPGHRRGRRCGP